MHYGHSTVCGGTTIEILKVILFPKMAYLKQVWATLRQESCPSTTPLLALKSICTVNQIRNQLCLKV